jgi:hypothetical protein
VDSSRFKLREFGGSNLRKALSFGSSDHVILENPIVTFLQVQCIISIEIKILHICFMGGGRWLAFHKREVEGSLVMVEGLRLGKKILKPKE